jgi:isopentenyl-diphosphate Delta-isomerase
MLDHSELLFTVDENNNPIEPIERHEAHKRGVWHRTTDIAVVNSKRQILCHKRSMLKDTGPGLWDACFGGHIGPGIDSLQGAIQELKEESGLSVNTKDLKFLGINQLARNNNKEFRYFYIYEWDGSAKDVDYETDEISEVKWISIQTWQSEIKDTRKWSPSPYLAQLLNYVNSSDNF